MSTAPCPDPNEPNEELFKAVDEAFSDFGSFLNEDGEQVTVEFLNPDVIEMEVARFRARLEAAPSGVSPHDEG
ncbi:hypothetical protein SEA_LUCKYSOCKE_120 [Streptomyces phage LuckySocke]|jgi:hypothetical protein|nr:hypothetical protein SEA_ALONE_124 [Streptomyces phage Alone3]WPH58948.1 hypothetical protein SEA_LUCKYSOCKE_120 [Streptomyces phage LuckySocke]